MLLTIPNHIKIMPKQSLSQVDKLSIGTSVLEPSPDMMDLRLPIASFAADSNQLDKFVVSSVMSSGKAIGVHEIGLWHEGELVAILYKTHDRVNHQPLFLIKPNFIYLVNLQIDEQTVTLTVDERDDLSFAMTGVLANTGKQSSTEKIALTNQFKVLIDKDISLENQISSLTGSVATTQQSADNANEKADTANTKADNAQNTANNALSRANMTNKAIVAEQQARADGDTALDERISAIDTAYKLADSQTAEKLGQIEQSINDKDQAMSQKVENLTNTLNNRTTWQIITTATDLNTLTETGKYFIQVGGNPNAPNTSHQYVNVEKANDGRIVQIARTDNNIGLLYERSRINGTWSAWGKIINQNDLNSRMNATNVGGRNLLLNSNVSLNKHGTINLDISPNIDFSLVQQLALACDIYYKNAVRSTKAGNKWWRAGVEIRIHFTDGTSQHFNSFQTVTTSPTNYNARRLMRFSTPKGKIIKTIDSAIIQIWDIDADEILVKNPKLELYHIMTDWTPATEDLQSVINDLTKRIELLENKK